MELALGLIAIVVIGLIIYFNRGTKGFDVNKDGKVDFTDVKTAVDNTVAGVKASADVNKDGVVDAGDVAVVAKTAKATVTGAVGEVKRTVSRAKKAAANPSAKKPAAKKAAAKPSNQRPKKS
jgi:hypothetical protein